MVDRRLDRTASLTAQLNAAQRAAETLRPHGRRLLVDPHSRYFVDAAALRLLLAGRRIADGTLRAFDQLCGGLHAHIILRARYADDVCAAAVLDGIAQLVVLGAGFDTTSLRRAADPITVFEVDAPPTQFTKRPIVEQRLPACHRNRIVWVPCDFEHDSVRERLLDSGLDAAQPTVILWLGVTPYLTSDAIDVTLADLAALSAPGSQLIVDYIRAGVATADCPSRSARRVARLVASRGEPYRSDFTMVAFEALVTGHGFRPFEHLGVRALLGRYDPGDTSGLASDDWLAVVGAERL